MGDWVCHLRRDSFIAAQTEIGGIWPAIPVQAKCSSCMNPTPHQEVEQVVWKMLQASLQRSNPRTLARSSVLWLACCRTDIPRLEAMQSSHTAWGDCRMMKSLTPSKPAPPPPSLPPN